MAGFLGARDLERPRLLEPEPEDVVEMNGQSELRLAGIAFAIGGVRVHLK